MTKLHMKNFPSSAMIQIKSTVANFSYKYSTRRTIHVTKSVKASIGTTSIKADFTQILRGACHFSYKRKTVLP